MNNKKRAARQKDILFVLISSFLVVVAWISFNIYHINVTSTIPDKVQAQLEPIDGQFDPAVREQLKKRSKVNPIYEKQGAADPKTTVTPTQAPVPTGPTTASAAAAPTNSQTESLPLLLGQ